jgi:acyl transferase domain-containing protein
VLALSARTPEALEAQVRAYGAYLAPGGQGHAYSLRDICYSAATRRGHHAHRLAVVGTSHGQMAAALSGAGDPEPASEAAERFRAGQAVEWEDLFGSGCRFVPLPRYPWQTKRYWLGERAVDERLDDPVDAVLRQYARSSYADDASLADIGIDSLATLSIVAELAARHGLDVDADDLAELRTVGGFRRWFRETEGQPA